MPSLILSVPMVAILAIGPFLSFSLTELSMKALLLWALTTFVAIAVAVQRPRIDARSLWIWIVLALFVVGYFGKTFYAARWIVVEGSLDALNPEWSDFGKAELVRSYETMSLAFLAFVLGSAVGPAWMPRLGDVQHDARRLWLSLAVTFLVALTLAVIRGLLGIGIMGVESEELPFALDTAIFRAQSSLIPAVLLVLMWAAERRNQYLLATLAALLLGAHLVTIAAVSASKAGLFYFASYVLCLWIVSDRLTRKRQAILAVVAVAALGLFVVGADLRVLRIEGLSLTEAIEAIRGASDLPLSARLDLGARALFLRISGADGLWFVLGDPASTLPLFDRWQAVWTTSIRDVFTRDIVGVTWLQDFRAPGFVAALLILFGSAGVALCACIGPVIGTAWAVLGRLPAGPALLAFFAVFVLQALMEGIFQWQDLVVLLLTVPAAVLFAVWLEGDSAALRYPIFARLLRSPAPS